MRLCPRLNSLTGFACLAALLLAQGCGKKQTEGDGAVVELSVLMDADTTGVWHELLDSFHAQNPGIRINYIEGPSATNTREDLHTTSFLSGETVYDLVFADVAWVPKFAAAGWIEDLTDRWPAERWDEFIGGSIAGGKYKGRIYRVPAWIDGGILYYRSDLLEAAGEQPPRSFDDLERIAQRVANPDELWGFSWQGRQYEGVVCNFLEVLVGHGGTWIDPESNEVGLDRPEAIAALQWMVDCIHRWRISPPGTTAYMEEDSRQLFHNGRAVFHRNWPYVWVLSQQAESPIRGKVGLTAMPAAPGGRSASTLGGWGFCIAKSSRHKDEAWRFIEFITALPQVERLHEVAGIPAALKSFYEKRSADPVQQAIYTVMQTTVPRPPVPQYAQASDILQRYVSAALTQRMTPEAALKGAARETRLLLGRGAKN